jgi:hypothetical protein
MPVHRVAGTGAGAFRCTLEQVSRRRRGTLRASLPCKTMIDNSLYIAIGAATGVLTAFFASTLNDLWSSGLLPLWRRWRYRGAVIAGEWKGLGTGEAPASGEWSEVVLTLKQDTTTLRGTMALRDRSAGHSIDLNLQAVGTTSRGYVTLSLWPASKTFGSVATALLKIDGDGSGLNGQLLYVGARETMEVINLSVHRARSIAAARLVPSAAAADRCSAQLN